jgi:2-methylcitrate dehydratase PrpD
MSGAASSPRVAEQAARAIASLTPSMLPAKLRRLAEDLVLDIFGLCLAARGTDYARAALAGWDGDGQGTVIGHARRLSAAGAAFVNGTAAHGEDFDDTFEGGPVHAGAVVVPAVLAAAERFGADGQAALLGIAVGTETICRLSLVAPRMVHKAGFHPTSVFGAMAAAAAVSATLDLDDRQIVDAWGIAGSMAGGIIEYLAEGAWTKRLHPGWAAQAGLQAALLARHGFTGPRSVFEGTHGLFNGFAHSAAGDYAKLTGDWGRVWLAETLAFKAYACGTMAHPYVDCAKRIAAHGVAAEDVADILCEVAEGTVHRLWEPLAQKQAPPNPYAAKFSVPFCIAVGFVTGDAGIAAFTAETIADTRIRALAAKVRYVVDPANPYPQRYTGHARATLRDGRVVEERQADLRGGARNPLSRAEIEAKFMANAAYGGWPGARTEAARALARRVFDGKVDLGALRG